MLSEYSRSCQQKYLKNILLQQQISLTNMWLMCIISGFWPVDIAANVQRQHCRLVYAQTQFLIFNISCAYPPPVRADTGLQTAVVIKKRQNPSTRFLVSVRAE